MRRARRSISLLLFLTSLCLTGCHSTHAQPTPARASATHAQVSPAPVSRHPPRDSALSVYNNPAHGVSFRYPRNYLLDDQPDSDDPSILLAQRELAEQQPGAILVSTVTIPPDAYPNTTFRGGTLQFVLNLVVTADTCRSFAVPTDDAYTSGSTQVRRINFDWRQRGWATAGTGTLNLDYAGFSNGACYEFFLEVVTGSNPDADPHIKDADATKIMHNLERIVSSLQFQSEAKSGSTKAPPVVHSFTVEPIFIPHLQNVARVSWEISGAAENEVFLRVNCPGLVELNPLPDSASLEGAPASATDPPKLEEPPDPYSRPGYGNYRLESIISCGKFTSIPPRSGSFRLQIEYHSAEPVSFTLFVHHLNYLTRPN